MDARSLFYTDDDLFFDARRIIQMLRDPRSNATQVGRAVQNAPQLLAAVTACAKEHFRGRGRVQSITHAVTLIGYRRLEHVVRSVVQQTYLEILDGEVIPSPASVQPPVTAPQKVQIAV